jgi:hypothetical protein
VGDLDGLWELERTGGALPPLLGVRKRIHGSRGETRLGGLPGVPFAVCGRALRYARPLSLFVDVIEGEGDVRTGRATVAGHEFGRFRMRRIGPG